MPIEECSPYCMKGYRGCPRCDKDLRNDSDELDLERQMDAASVIKGIGGMVGGAAAFIPGAGPVVGIIEAALGLAADLIQAGLNPIREIQKIRDTHPALVAMRAEWNAAIEKKFGSAPASIPTAEETHPSAPPTAPSIYDED